MTRFRLTHLNDEELALVADAFMSKGEMETNPHLASCDECQQAVLEALRGLAVLSSGSEPPADLAAHVRARRWAVAHDRSPATQLDAVEDIAEVGGRGADPDEHETENPPSDSETRRDDE